MPMLDDPKKTAQLMTELKAAVPFKVELTPWLINQEARECIEEPHLLLNVRIHCLIFCIPAGHIPYRGAV
jgi:hypothetical protein